MVPINVSQKIKTNDSSFQPKEISLNQLLGSRICYMEFGFQGGRKKVGLVRYNRTDEIIYINWEDGSKDTRITTLEGAIDPEGSKVLESSFIV